MKITNDSLRSATTAMLHADGRITVPREIRQALGLKPGDKLNFSPHKDNLAATIEKAIASLAHIPDRTL